MLKQPLGLWTSARLKAARGQYDKYDRKGPKIFVGEWGAYETPFEPWNPRSRGEAPTPNLRAAIGDAAWMTEMERNSDLVIMHCYAPLLVNGNPGARQWRPNLIGYDARRFTDLRATTRSSCLRLTLATKF